MASCFNCGSGFNEAFSIPFLINEAFNAPNVSAKVRFWSSLSWNSYKPYRRGGAEMPSIWVIFKDSRTLV